MRNDLRYALRGLARAPGFALAAVLTLALGIGANTAIFSVVDAVLLRALPYPESHRLVMVWDQLTKLGVERFPVNAQDFKEYSAQDRIFDQTAALAQQARNLAGGVDAERVATLAVTTGFFPMLGAAPAIGRGFAAEEYRPEHDNVAILSHSLFTRRYGGAQDIIGRSIRLDGRSYTVVGVLPPDFGFSLTSGGVDVWTPLPITNEPRWGTLRMLARLRPGISLPAAQSEMTAVAAHYEESAHPYRGPNGEDPGFHVKVVSLREQLLGEFRTATLILFAAVAAVLLIACANVANLLLVRAVSREKEIAVRRALGASSGRLVRQWMTEAATLAVLGGGLGCLVALWGVRALIALSPAALPAAARIGIDWRALVFTLAVSASVSLLFGLAPSVAASRVNWTARRSRPKRRAASVLVTTEVALALMLLIGAGLLLKSFARLSRVNAGFNPSHLLTLHIQLPQPRYSEAHRRVEFFATLHQRLSGLPGVISMGAVSRLPVNGGLFNSRGGNPFSIEGRPWNPDGAVPQIAHTQSADPDYFHTVQIPLISGRLFSDADSAGAPRVAVVNQTLARGFFPRGDAIGRHILLGAPHPGARWLTIVGIAGDVKTAALDQDALPQFYTAQAQDAPNAMAIVIRTSADPMALARQAAAMVHTIDPDQPVYDVKTMEQRMAQSIAQPRFESVLLAFFAGAALFLATLGIFGVVAHSTQQRTQEIGIRLALGADAARVLQGVVLGGLRPVLTGVALGLAGAAAMGRMLSSVLFRVSPTDPATFTLAGVVLAGVAVAACLGPARKATRIDPMAALRSE